MSKFLKSKEYCFLFIIPVLFLFIIIFYSHIPEQVWAASSISNPTSQKNATTTKNTDFLLYDNETIGFKMQYPSTWKSFELPNTTSNTIRFVSPFENSSDRYRETVDVSLFILNNTSLDLLITNTTKVLKGTLNDFQIIQSNTTTFAGYPTWNLVYIYSDPMIGMTKSMLTSILQNDMFLYMIKYFAKPADYASSLPIVNKMIDSFKLYS